MYLDASNQSPELLCLVKTETLYQLNNDSFPLPHQPLLIIILLSVSMNLTTLDIHINGIIQYFLFCDLVYFI